MKKPDILSGPIWSSILLFSLPIALSSLLQQLFNAADQVVVGRFAGSLALAAVGANTPLISLCVNVFSAASVGSNAMIARRIGEGNKESINKIVHTSIAFALLAGVILAALIQVVAMGLESLIGTPADVAPTAALYLRIYALGFPFALLYNFGSAILRSIGDTKRPTLALISAGVINVILNLIFVIFFHMGVLGVACATSISNVFSSLTVLRILSKEDSDLRFSFRKLRIDKTSLMEVLRIGAPASMQGATFSISNVCIQSGINSLGSAAIAGTVIALNFDFISFFITSSFNQAAITFCSQNYGAGNYDRVKRIIRTTLLSSLICEASFDILCVLLRYQLTAIFTDDPIVTAIATKRFLISILPHFFIVGYEILSASMRSLGYSLAPAILTVIGSVCFRVLWLVTVFRIFPSYEVLSAVYPASWVLTNILVISYYLHVRKKIFAKN